MLNSVNIMGNLTRDPELRKAGEVSMCSFTVAVDRDFTSRESGERETDFIDCVAWRKDAEFLCKYFKKGSPIVVTGRLRSRSWTDKDDNRRRVLEVEVADLYFGDTKKGSRDTNEETE